MEAFCQKYEAKIAGVLSCFDRMLFRGYLPIMSGASMAQFLQSEQVNCENLKHFLLDTAHRLKWHAERMAAEAGRDHGRAGMRVLEARALPDILVQVWEGRRVREAGDA
jgi:hypothetical protein